MFEPFSDPFPHEASHDHEIICIADESGIGKPSWGTGIVFEGAVQLMEVDVREQRRKHAALWSLFIGAHPPGVPVPVFFLDRASKPQADKPEYRLVSNPSLNLCHQSFMIDGVKVTGQICVIHLCLSGTEVRLDFLYCVLGTAARAKSVRTIFKIGLEDRFQNQLGRHLGHPVPDARNAMWTHLPISLGNVSPLHRSWTIGFVAERISTSG